ncbi:MAG: polyprenyl synthetase family protein [Microthrixaceae bacterium]
MTRIHSTDLAEWTGLIDVELAAIIGAWSPRTPARLQGSLEHTLLLPGKRIRPLMAMVTFAACGRKPTAILRPACALELYHAGSLILDDLPSMDNAGKRRGAETNHVLFGESTAILASAGLWVEGYRLLAETGVHGTALCGATSRLLGGDGLVAGQYADLNQFDRSVTIDELLECYRLKTAALFRLAAYYAAVLAEAPDEDVEGLDRFATIVGTAFQVRDDILDDDDASGKDAGKDGDNAKPNVVTLLGADGARDLLASQMSAASEVLERLGTAIDVVNFEVLLDKLAI